MLAPRIRALLVIFHKITLTEVVIMQKIKLFINHLALLGPSLSAPVTAGARATAGAAGAVYHCDQTTGEGQS